MKKGEIVQVNYSVQIDYLYPHDQPERYDQPPVWVNAPHHIIKPSQGKESEIRRILAVFKHDPPLRAVYLGTVLRYVGVYEPGYETSYYGYEKEYTQAWLERREGYRLVVLADVNDESPEFYGAFYAMPEHIEPASS